MNGVGQLTEAPLPMFQNAENIIPIMAGRMPLKATAITIDFFLQEFRQ